MPAVKPNGRISTGGPPLDFYDFTRMKDLARLDIQWIYWFSAHENFLSPVLQEWFKKTIEYYRIETNERGNFDWMTKIPKFGEILELVDAMSDDENEERGYLERVVIERSAATIKRNVVGNSNASFIENVPSDGASSPGYGPDSPTYSRNFSPERFNDEIDKGQQLIIESPASPHFGERTGDLISDSGSGPGRSLASTKPGSGSVTNPPQRYNYDSDNQRLSSSVDRSISPACSLIIDEECQAASPPIATASTSTPQSAAATNARPAASRAAIATAESYNERPEMKRMRMDSPVPSPPSSSHHSGSPDLQSSPPSDAEMTMMNQKAKHHIQREEMEKRNTEMENRLAENREQNVINADKKMVARSQRRTDPRTPPFPRPSQMPVAMSDPVPVFVPPAVQPPQLTDISSPIASSSPSAPLHLSPPRLLPMCPAPSSIPPPQVPQSMLIPPPWLPEMAKNCPAPTMANCAFCKGAHPPERCTLYSTFDTRQSRLNELHLCFHCLDVYHPSRCKQPSHMKACTHCGIHQSHVAMCRRLI